MGLDMYLEAERTIYAVDEDEKKMNDELRKTLEKFFEGIDSIRTGNLDYTTVVIEVAYWRKANQIHRWFVKNVQGGNDDCGRYWVSREKLEELKKLCEEVIAKSKVIDGTVTAGLVIDSNGARPILEVGKVIENPEVATELLPRQSGCFFGNIEYNEWYLNDLKRTVEIIDRVLKLPKKWSFYYRSSW